MVTVKTWEEFRETGLLLIINQILHIFGWAIVYEINLETKEVKNVYPARVKFRGFDNNSTSHAYQKVSTWMKNNSNELYDETFEKEKEDETDDHV